MFLKDIGRINIQYIYTLLRFIVKLDLNEKLISLQ